MLINIQNTHISKNKTNHLAWFIHGILTKINITIVVVTAYWYKLYTKIICHTYAYLFINFPYLSKFEGFHLVKWIWQNAHK